MAAEPSKQFVSLLLLTLIFLSCTNLSSSENPKISDQYPTGDIHSLLPRYDFPKGLFPNVPNSYTLSDEGELEVELNTTCYVQFDNLLYYEKKITGKLTKGSLKDLTGFQMRRFLFWVPITDIYVDLKDNALDFFTGGSTERIATERFEKVRNCNKRPFKRSLFNSL